MTWEIWPRDRGLGRTHDPLSGWRRLALVERHNHPDTWEITGAADVLGVFEPGMGAVLFSDGEQVTSGAVTSIKRSGAGEENQPVEQMQVGFAEDLDVLTGRVVLPDPAHVLTTAITTMAEAYDTRTGPLETLLLGYVSAHAASAAQVSRRVSRLRLPASLGRGGTSQVTARLDSLGRLVHDLADAGNLAVGISHVEDGAGPWLDLSVSPVADLSADIRFGGATSAAMGQLATWSYELLSPTCTRAIVAGGGQLAAREFIQVIDADAEDLWDTVRELVIDQRQVDVTSADRLAEYTRAATDALVEGAGPVSVAFTPTLGPDLRYRRDVHVGDIVGYDLPGLDPAAEKIRQVTTTVTAQQGEPTETVSVIVGTPDAPLPYRQRQIYRAMRQITAIQRST